MHHNLVELSRLLEPLFSLTHWLQDDPGQGPPCKIEEKAGRSTGRFHTPGLRRAHITFTPYPLAGICSQ